jgi:hypothetical protein
MRNRGVSRRCCGVPVPTEENAEVGQRRKGRLHDLVPKRLEVVAKLRGVRAPS